MCKTRLDAVDNSSQTREELFIFARNFAGEADKLEGEIKQQQAEIEGLQAVADDCLFRLQELEEVSKRDDETWYWSASGDAVGEAAEAKGGDDAS